MNTVNIYGRCSYCSQEVKSSGGCVRKECLDARMKAAMKHSPIKERNDESTNGDVIRNVFVKN